MMNRLLSILSAFLIVGTVYAQSEQMRRLEQEIDKSNARRLVIEANSPRDFEEYIIVLKAKIERVGALNYPAEARGKAYSSASVQFEIRSDGSVGKVVLLKSSGYKVIDDAAVRAINLAAPYSPFSSLMKESADVVVIVQKIQFN